MSGEWLIKNMRIKQERNTITGKRNSALNRGEGKFWEDRKQTLRTATLEQEDHILI